MTKIVQVLDYVIWCYWAIFVNDHIYNISSDPNIDRIIAR